MSQTLTHISPLTPVDRWPTRKLPQERFDTAIKTSMDQMSGMVGQLNDDFIPAVNSIGQGVDTVINSLPAIQAAPGHAASAAQGATTATQKAGEASDSATAALAAENNADTARTGAEMARDAAITAKTGAEAARDAALAARDGAVTARDAALASQAAAETSNTGAAQSATTATQKAGEASDSATAALAARTAAETALDGAETARDAAITAKTEAEAARDAAQAIVGITLSDAAPAAATGAGLAGVSSAVSRADHAHPNFLERAASLGDLSGDITLDMAAGRCFAGTVTGALTIAAPDAGEGVCLLLALLDGGSHTVTWSMAPCWAGGMAPTLTAGGIDVIALTRGPGNIWYGVHVAADARA